MVFWFCQGLRQGCIHVLAGPISSEGASSGVVGNSQDVDEAMSTPNGRIKQRPQSSGVRYNTLLMPQRFARPSSSRRRSCHMHGTSSGLQLIQRNVTIG